jgi:AAA+ superfamily predicted ATPase
MKVIISEEWFDDIKKVLTKAEAADFADRYRWASKKGRVKVEIENFSDKSLEWLRRFLEGKAEAGGEDSGSARLSAGQVRQWVEIRKDPDGQVVTKLENLPSAMKAYIAKSEHRYLFEQMPDGNMVPWFVEGIKYEEPAQYRQANVAVSMLALNSGYSPGRRRSGDEAKTLAVLSQDIRKRTVSQVLREKGYHLETPERMVSYGEERGKYLELAEQDGLQMSVTGKCHLTSGWYDTEFRGVEKAGRPAKMVVDPQADDKEQTAVECPYWDDKPEGHLWQVPAHPVLRMFDLDEHAHYRVHVVNAVPYEYDVGVGRKLVLPADVKDFIETLVEYSSNRFVDIVGGKEGGTIILLEGPPGTGKTLSAEVYSEVMRRPLYKVQSSQLGTSAKDLEDELKTVLQRAERWGAILLIDEADVYIRARGEDIEQNAIVGVFLRVLEYYRGVLFMTTNRGTSVDDAIVSRVTARFHYRQPSEGEQAQLWRVLSEQNKIALCESEILRIVGAMPKMTGRDIKNILKLAYVAALKGKCSVSAELVSKVAKFKQSQQEGV